LALFVEIMAETAPHTTQGDLDISLLGKDSLFNVESFGKSNRLEDMRVCP